MITKRREEINRKNFASLLNENVSELCKIYDGSGYAFVKLSLANKGLLGIYEGVWKYPHLREIELNNNFLSSFQTLAKLQYLVTLNLAKNQIDDVNLLANDDSFPRLEVLNLSGNRIKKLSSVYIKRIKRLNLNHNHIDDISDFDGNKTLEVL
jgi:Leucine-rich repeat (LRR) protein